MCLNVSECVRMCLNVSACVLMCLNVSEYRLDVILNLLLLCLQHLRGIPPVLVCLPILDESLEVALLVLQLPERLVATHDAYLDLVPLNLPLSQKCCG